MNDFFNILPPIHPEGTRFIAIFAAFTAVLYFIWVPLGLIGLVLTLWCTYFFRDPERVTPRRAGLVISPADGVVCAINQVHWPQELRYGGPTVWRISIFMNVFNVHVNRIPIAGEITKMEYIPGKFFNASLDKASEDNERQMIAMKTGAGAEFAIVQIAGLIARRIVCYPEPGQKVQPGERFGLIRFGSRVDLYLPDGCNPLVTIGQVTVGGETVLADLKSNEVRRMASKN